MWSILKHEQMRGQEWQSSCCSGRCGGKAADAAPSCSETGSGKPSIPVHGVDLFLFLNQVFQKRKRSDYNLSRHKPKSIYAMIM